MADDNKALIASSEFDPSSTLKGIDDMTKVLERLNAQEDQLRQTLNNTTAAMAANTKQLKSTQDQITNLDKTSATYTDNLKDLNAQQDLLNKQQQALQATYKDGQNQLGQINQSADKYKSTLSNLGAVAKQVQDANKGRSLFDITSMNQQVATINELGAKLKDLFAGRIDTHELDALEAKLAESRTEFQQLSTVLDFVKEKMQTLDPNTQDFKDLNQLVGTGEELLQNYGNVLEKTDERSASLVSQLRQVKNELAELEHAGQTGTERFQELTKEAAHLQEALNLAGERVTYFANNTRLLEAGVETLRGLAAATELVEGTTALFGIKNEAAEESIKRLNAIMAIANGLQEVSNLLKKESVVRLVAEEVATKGVALSQRILAIAFGTTAAASRGLAVALAATGIGALVVGIGLLISALMKWSEEDKELTRAQELLNAGIETTIELNKRFIEAIGDAGAKFRAEAELRQAQNEKLIQSDIEQAKTRIKNAQEVRDIELKTLEDQAAEAAKLVRDERASYDAAANRRRAALEGTVKISDDELAALNKTVDNYTKIQDTAYALQDQVELKRINNQRDQLRDRNELRRAEIAQYNDFLKRLQELQKQLALAQLAAKPQDAQALQKQAAVNLTAQLQAIDRDVTKGTLSKGQGGILKTLLGQINSTELATTLRDFKKKAAEAATQLQDTIFDTQLKVGEQRASLIRDTLAQEAATIKIEFEKESASLTRDQRELLRGIQDAADQGLISKTTAEQNAAAVTAVYTRLFAQLQEKTVRAQEKLAADAFKKLQEDTQAVFAGVQVFVSEAEAEAVGKLTQRYLSHQVTYEQYQRELTKIHEKYARQRIDTDLREAKELLAGVQARIKLEQDPTRLKELQDQERQLRQRIADLKKQLNEADVQGVQTDKKQFADKITEIASYAQAIGGIIDQVVGFWAAANEAEAKSLDRSIALQEKRVDAATRIAERGNAEYLRLEQDRLDELRVKQENNARRQLAINAVLQTSQALTAFITALAQGIATGGPLGGLAIAAAVLGAIASGYAIVQSLQPDSPQTFREGTKSVQRKGAPAGEDTVPAMLTEGEAVLPVDVNKDYADAVGAIYDRKVPAEQLNNFVNNYHVNRRQLPRLDHERVSQGADMVVSFDGQLLEATQQQNRKLDEQAGLLRDVHRQLKSMGFSVNLDKNGLAVAVAQSVKQMEINKKV